MIHELQHHRAIKLSMYDQVTLFFQKIFCPCLVARMCTTQTPRGLRLNRLWERGTKRLEHDFDVERLVKQLRDIRIFFRERVFDEKIRFQIQHNKKNVIDVEESTTNDELMLPPPQPLQIELPSNAGRRVSVIGSINEAGPDEEDERAYTRQGQNESEYPGAVEDLTNV